MGRNQVLILVLVLRKSTVWALCSKSTSAGYFKVQLGNHSDCEPGGRTSLTILFPGRSETSPPMSPASPHIWQRTSGTSPTVSQCFLPHAVVLTVLVDHSPGMMDVQPIRWRVVNRMTKVADLRPWRLVRSELQLVWTAPFEALNVAPAIELPSESTSPSVIHGQLIDEVHSLV